MKLPPLTNPFYKQPRPASRLPAENFETVIDGHSIGFTISRDPKSGHVVEVAFRHPKIGHGLDLMLQDLGIALSRAMQGRDPATGEKP